MEANSFNNLDDSDPNNIRDGSNLLLESFENSHGSLYVDVVCCYCFIVPRPHFCSYWIGIVRFGIRVPILSLIVW